MQRTNEDYNAVANDVWFPFYVGDYLKKANHLSQGEHGAYLGLLLYYYSRGAPIPHNKRYAIAYAHAEQEQCNVDAVLDEFFTKDGDLWVHNRCEEELLKRADLSEKRQQAALKRHAKAPAIAPTNAEQLDTQSQSQSQSQSYSELQSKPQPKKVRKNADNETRLGEYLEQIGGLPPIEWGEWANQKHGWDGETISLLWDNFANNYWLTDNCLKLNGGRKADWAATWRNFCNSKAQNGFRGRTNGGVSRDNIAAAFSTAMARRHGAVFSGGGVSGGDAASQASANVGRETDSIPIGDVAF